MKGLDISKWNVGLNFGKVKSMGYEFIIPRDGWSTETDPQLQVFVNGAKANGIEIPGVYHFVYAINKDEVIQNAKTAIANLEKVGLSKSTVIWCDWEYDSVEKAKDRGVNLTNAQQKEFVCTFCDYLLSQGYLTGVYVNQDYMARVFGKDFGKRYDLWLSDLEGGAAYECVYRQIRYDKIGNIQVDVDEYYGQYTANTAKPKQEGTMRYIKKLIPAKTYIDGAKKLLERKLEYNNRAPYNCGYCHSDLHLSGDCWCINPKVMVWSISMGKPVWENKTPGFYYYTDGINASGLPDWDGQSILNGYCEDISFKKMLSENIAPALLLNGSATHMGAYIGEFTMHGNTYNVTEFTPASGISPYMHSYVDENGYRRVCKGGKVISSWARAGRMTGIIDYTNKGEIMPTPTNNKPYSIDNLAVHIMRGDFGSGDARKKAIKKLGYTDAEIQKAQDIVNSVYAKKEMDELACQLAMKFIDGSAGDGVTMRREWIAKNYPKYDMEKLFRKTQDKVNDFLS